MGGSHPDRIIPCQVTWLHDPEIAAAEIRRNAGRGFKAVAFSENPEKLGLPSIYKGHWDPFSRPCQETETETVVDLHVGSSSETMFPSTDSDLAVLGVLFPVNGFGVGADWLFARIPLRFPGLRIVLSEGGIGWVPILLDRLSYMARDDDRRAAFGGMTPIEVFHRNFWFTTFSDGRTLALRAQIGIDRIMFETDYPHTDSSWPDTQAIVAAQLAGAPRAAADRMTYRNAASLYRHPLPADLTGTAWPRPHRLLGDPTDTSPVHPLPPPLVAPYRSWWPEGSRAAWVPPRSWSGIAASSARDDLDLGIPHVQHSGGASVTWECLSSLLARFPLTNTGHPEKLGSGRCEQLFRMDISVRCPNRDRGACMTIATDTIPTSSPSAPKREHGPLFRFFFVHEIDQYPTTGRRSAYLSLAVLATIILYYTYYTQTGVTPNILRYYHMSFTYYVWIVIISNALGAFASLPASKTDKLGRANVIIYGLLIVGLLILFGVPNVGTELGFAIVISAIGLVEGAILVATPAMVRDFSPQLGRASAMGFWTVGPVAGSLTTSIVARTTLSHFVDWQSQFIISGLSAVATFLICLFFMRDLSSRVRDQLMVSMRDQALVEARARGLSDTELKAATEHPWRQIAKWDLAGSAFGIATFLLVYYVAAGFFPIYFTVNFVNANGISLSTSQVNGLSAWFWGADIVSLIIVGWLSDRLRVRKPLMLVGAVGAIVTLIVFLGDAAHPHTSYFTLAFTSCILASFLSLAYAPWMAGYTESVEAKNPALVATGLALWGWIFRLVVAISFIFLPVVITSVNPVVDNRPIAAHVIDGQPIQNFVVVHADSVTFATEHAALLKVLTANTSVANAVAANPSAANVAAAEKALGAANFAQLVKYQTQLKKLVHPYEAQLNYLSAHQGKLAALQNAVKESSTQWQHWFWVDIAGMVVFIPTIWLIGGPWGVRKAKRDAEEHDRAVKEELARLLRDDPSRSPA